MKHVKIKIDKNNFGKVRVRSNLARSTMIEADKKKIVKRKKKHQKIDD